MKIVTALAGTPLDIAVCRLGAALLAFATLEASACPLCLGAYQALAAQQLAAMQRSVLAVPLQDGSGYRSSSRSRASGHRAGGSILPPSSSRSRRAGRKRRAAREGRGVADVGQHRRDRRGARALAARDRHRKARDGDERRRMAGARRADAAVSRER